VVTHYTTKVKRTLRWVTPQEEQSRQNLGFDLENSVHPKFLYDVIISIK